MTKLIRVENADLGTAKVVVEVWEKGKTVEAFGVVAREPDRLVKTHELPLGTCMMQEHIWAGRYLVVRE